MTCFTLPVPTSWKPLYLKKTGYEGSSITSSSCRQAVNFHGHRSKHGVMGLLGPFNLSRAYYYCGRCGKGSFPFDEQARLSPRKLTPAAEEIVCQAGVLSGDFAEAAEKVLAKQPGLHISESIIERVTQDAGARLGGWLEQGITLGERVQWTWHTDNNGRRVGYLSVDATGVQQQGPNASKADDGRIPYVAMVYNPPPEKLKSSQQEPPAQDLPANRSSQASRFDAAAPTPKPPKKMQARYLAGLYTLPLLGLMLRK